MPVKPIPDDYHSVAPYLTVRGVAKLIDFLKRSFGAAEKERMTQPAGRIMHAEVRIGDSVVMMGEPADESSLMPGAIHVYVEDVDTAYRRALQAGATSLRAPEDQFYGDRSAGVRDPSGNIWWIATHKEDVSPEEMKRRAQAFMRQQRER